ncbi:MAG TPA: asparagine synthase-related protein [Candidatus Acidoferrales bacterium]|nr:asparagine synthase-related protein [Candidatus Acidoferrales bacterium]
MSGIAGIVNLDGAPVDRDLLERMASSVAYRGPDASEVWTRGPTGFVHTSFRTTFEAQRERQPMSLDGEVWITADARIDGREDLLAELRGHGCTCSPDATDPELILHAYAVWRERSVEHLIGDFAFAIWDHRERKLFCARDHFGVKPFFYAHVNEALVFSNAMDCPRLHPDAPDDLYEPEIADFLVLGAGFDLERTAREVIRRLAPAHVLIAVDDKVCTRRYWTLPVDPPTVFRRSQEYVERFLELFEQAVADRLRTDRAAVLMSGGMDSTSVAAMAKRAAGKSGSPCAISAHSQVYHRLIQDREARFASAAARYIGIPLTEFALDDRQLLGFWDRPEFRRAEPWKTPLFDGTLSDVLGRPVSARVVLTGQGGDGIFSSLRKRHCLDRIRSGDWVRLAGELSRYVLSEGRRHRLQLRFRWQALAGRGATPRPFPVWLNPEFERRLHLRERYERYEAAPVWSRTPVDAVRPEAHGLMSSPIWAGLFEEYDPDNFGACVDARHPFFDLRLVRYVLSLPALPWCSDKELLRRSMRGLLPDEVRLRRKQPIASDLLTAFYQSSRKSWLDDFEPDEALGQYVDFKRAKECIQNPPPWEVMVHLRPMVLNFWLKWQCQSAYKVHKEEFRVPTH